jgi:endonuclease III
VNKRAVQILDVLEEAYPDARVYLDSEGAFQLLIATILSAQCTDVRVNMTTPALFARYATPAAIADADPADIEEIIRPLGFFRMKARSIIACSRHLVDDCDGRVPETMDGLLRCRGVGRKTASVVLAGAFGQQTIAVDTHVGRVARRLGLSKSENPEKVERDLRRVWPESRWTHATKLAGALGRRVCHSRKPVCAECPVRDMCKRVGVA